MKKTALTFLLLLTGLCVFAQNGVIQQLSGTVELKLAGSSAYVPAKAGDRVSQDTVISTGFKSTALVEVGSAILTVRPLTRLTLTEIRASSGTESLSVNLQTGRVRVDVNPPAGTRTSMAVTSPIATASVRGTSFEFDTRNLYTRHGIVSFHGKRGGQMLVDAGSDSLISDGGKATDPIENKKTRFRPKAPVGTDRSGGSGGEASSNANGLFILDLNFSKPGSESPYDG